MTLPAGKPERFTEARWQEFMSEPRGLYTLGEALMDPRTYDEAAERILHTILTPDVRKLGFPLSLEHEEYGMLNQALRRRDQWLEHLYPKNAEKAADIIGKNLDELKDESSMEAETSRRQLINLIPFVIPKVSDDAAGKLIERFDIDAYIDVRDSSHSTLYDPLENLFLTKGVKDVWKMVVAKSQVHPKIETEKPRKGINWKKIFEGEEFTLAERYARILDRSLDKRLLDQGRFVEEIGFLIDNTQFLDRVLPIFVASFVNIMDVCMRVDPRIANNLFEKFARHRLFTVGYDRQEELAKTMMDHFMGDREIALYLLEQLQGYEKRKVETTSRIESDNERQKLHEQRINAIKRGH